ncbi:MAG: hypothetical protein HYR56_18005 [Acidobacteria bacterium]|nr:hypothetical protein [Acidobacteriota bacterium]MBI3422496.1 hypothetical protein [Acidobacteriota bacterium]
MRAKDAYISILLLGICFVSFERFSLYVSLIIPCHYLGISLRPVEASEAFIYEGVHEATFVETRPVELISAIVKAETWDSNILNAGVYLKSQARIRFDIRSVSLKSFQPLSNEKECNVGFNNIYTISKAGVTPGNIYALAKTNQCDDCIAPVVIYHLIPPKALGEYKFNFLMNQTASDLNVSIKHKEADKVVLRCTYNYDSGKTATVRFGVVCDMSSEKQGDYAVVVSGHFISGKSPKEGKKPFNRSFFFYHQPKIAE